MMIQNADRCYQVMRFLSDNHSEGTQKIEEFLCMEYNGREKDACLLVRITDTALAKTFLLFLEERIRNQEFADYVECFQADGAFYAVFRYSLEQSLTERLNAEYCSLQERVQIAKGLLEQLLILNPHPYFAWNGLKPELITVSRSLYVHWNYHLEKIGQFDDCTMKDVGLCLLKVLRLLFEKEEQKQLYPLLEKYFEELRLGQNRDYLEMYQKFLPVCEELLQAKDQQLPQTFAFRMWEKLKKLFGMCKKVLAVLIILAALLYVVQTIRDDSGSQVMSKSIQQIGDLLIK